MGSETELLAEAIALIRSFAGDLCPTCFVECRMRRDGQWEWLHKPTCKLWQFLQKVDGRRLSFHGVPVVMERYEPAGVRLHNGL